MYSLLNTINRIFVISKGYSEMIVTVITYLGASTALLTLYKELLLPVWNARKAKKKYNITGDDWLSAWEPKAVDEPSWVNERVTINQNIFGRITISNNDNSEGYKFTCRGKYKRKGDLRYLVGTWDSDSKEDSKCGLFQLAIRPSGLLIGTFTGPNTQDLPSTGGWVLARKDFQLAEAKLWYNKGYLTITESKAIKQLKHKS